MAFIRLTSALAAASMLAVASASAAPAVTAPPAPPTLTPSVSLKNPIATPTVTKPANAIVEVGCFATPGLSFENHGPYLFQTEGNCQLICLQLEKNVLGVSDGTDCWCGDTIPAQAYQIDNSTCDTGCAGDNAKHCGGPNLLWVALSGNTRNKVANDPNPSSSSTAASSATAQPVATGDSKSGKGGSSTIAIAVGVVVGIVGVFALGFGVWFFLRRRRQRQAEEDYRRQAANVNQFVNGGKLHTSNSSMNDSRLDPSFVDRRQSNGSIADNEDYSRRILKVTNA